MSADLSLLQSQQPGASRMISTVRLDFDNGPSQDVELDDSSLHGQRPAHRGPAGATFVGSPSTGRRDRPDGTDPGPSAVGFAELGVAGTAER